jgi:hypothetical protein
MNLLTFLCYKKQNVLLQPWLLFFLKYGRNRQSISLDFHGSAGGLAILWNPTTFLLENFFITSRILIAQFKPIGSDATRFITNVYGLQHLNEKYDFLQSLQNITDFIDHQF